MAHFRLKLLKATALGAALVEEAHRADRVRRQHRKQVEQQEQEQERLFQLKQAVEGAASSSSSKKKKLKKKRLSETSRGGEGGRTNRRIRKDGELEGSLQPEDGGVDDGERAASGKEVSFARTKSSNDVVPGSSSGTNKSSKGRRSSVSGDGEVRVSFMVKEKISEHAVSSACASFLRHERLLIVEQHQRDLKVARVRTASEHAELTQSVAQVALMDEDAMVAFLEDSPYSMGAALKSAEAGRELDRKIAQAKHQCLDVLHVPLPSLFVYSGPARKRFEAAVYSLVADQVEPRMGLN